MNADSLAAVSSRPPHPKGRRHDGQSGLAVAYAVVGGPCVGVVVLVASVLGMRIGIRGVVVPDMLSSTLTQLLLVNVALGLAVGVVAGLIHARYRVSQPVGTVPVIALFALLLSLGTAALCCPPSAAGEVDGHDLARRMLQATVGIYMFAVLLVLAATSIRRNVTAAPHDARTTEPPDAMDSR